MSITPFIEAHQSTLGGISNKFSRFLYSKIDWNERCLAVMGPRGVGKTTLLLQRYLDTYNSVEKCLYVTCDHILLGSYGLFQLAHDYFNNGGQALILDEVHKHPAWAQEVKNIFDTFKSKKVLLSGSSATAFAKGIGDLSRRIATYHLPVMSFREFLNLEYQLELKPIVLKDLLKNHVQIANSVCKKVEPLAAFKNYLRYGCYPFYLEGKGSFSSKLAAVVEKVIAEDIPAVHSLSQSKIPILRKMLWLVASSPPFVPNIEGIARDLGQSKEYTYRYFEFLKGAGLIEFLRSSARPAKIARKPEKIFINDTNLLLSLTGASSLEHSEGTLRETFFLNQIKANYTVAKSMAGDFRIGKIDFEIGGPSKNFSQIRNSHESYLVIDGITQGIGRRVPLYLFGMLY